MNERMTIIFAILGLFIPAAITSFSILFAMRSFKKTIQREDKRDEKTDKSSYEKCRPEVELSSLTLYPNEFEVYVGEKVEWWKGASRPEFDKSIIGQRNKYERDEKDENKNKTYIKIIEDRIRKDTVLRHENSKGTEKEYMFINLCKESDFGNLANDVVLAFDVLKFRLKFNNNKVDKVRIKKAYSMIKEDESFGNDIKINVTFPVSGDFLEIPVAYAYINLETSSVKINNIYTKLAEQGKKEIDFLQSRNNAGDYIGFIETAYLIECLTTDDEVYEYSLFLEVDKSGWLIPRKIRNGDNFFNKKADIVNNRIRKNTKNDKANVIQVCVYDPDFDTAKSHSTAP
ncbi:MAG: hypothetical protein FWD71_00060 [Oscillospiraceae bacterium]|nr:hypothetical protein [Oscillospiraceae bacterium]